MAYNARQVFSAIMEIHHLVQKKHSPYDEAYKRIPAILKSVFAIDLLSLYEFDYQNKKMILRYNYGNPTTIAEVVNFLGGKGNTKRIADLHRPLWTRVPSNLSQEIQNKKGVNSFGGVPIIINGFLIGVLACGSYQPDAFGRKETVLLDLFGGLIGQLLIKNQWIDSRIRDHINL